MRPSPLLVLAAMLCLLVAAPAICAASDVTPVSSATLVEEQARWDGKRVRFTGEVIGSAMIRGDVAWLHINDDPYGLSEPNQMVSLKGFNSGQAVLVPASFIDKIERFGSYDQRGDLLLVEGVFHAADSRYGGDMLIEADALTVLRPGQDLDHPVPSWKLGLVAGLLVTTGLAFLLLLRRRATIV